MSLIRKFNRVTDKIYQALMEWAWLPHPAEGVFLPYMAGILALLVAMSFHLARQFALTNADLSEQLAQVSALSEKTIQQEVSRKLLQKDIEHKEKQLEEAARLEQALKDQIDQRISERLQATLDAGGEEPLETRLLKLTIEAADDVAREIVEQCEPTARPVCARGCCYCCYGTLEISRPEARALARYLRQRLHPDNALTLAGVLVDYEEATAGLSSRGRSIRRTSR